MKSWRDLVTDNMNKHGDDWAVVEAISIAGLSTVSGDERAEIDRALDQLFENGFGLLQGQPFTIWTKSRIYFPVTYDGKEWVESVPRHPVKDAAHHIGQS